MPVETGEPVEDYRILCGHGCIGHPAFPAPSYFWGERTCKPRTQCVARMRTRAFLPFPSREGEAKDYDPVNPLETILGHQWTDLCPKEWCDSHDLPRTAHAPQ